MDFRIAAFITASIAAHGGVALWLVNANPTLQVSLGGEARALRVALLPATQVTDYSALETRSVQAQPADKKTDPAVIERSQPVTRYSIHGRQPANDTSRLHVAKTDPDIIQKTELQTAPAAKPGSSAENISKRISAALKNQLARHFKYPWLARQRGWQGQVLLSLHIASNGDLSNWKVVQTSGYRTLDRSALKAVQRIEHLPQAEHWLKGGSLNIHLPVQYKLLDS